jgi:muramoyltetrapeptide carboxypeptidase
VWFARGGYGAARIAQDAMGLLGRRRRARPTSAIPMAACCWPRSIAPDWRPVHAPMPVDLRREGGEAAVRRVLDWLSGDSGAGAALPGAVPVVAFNLMTLAMIMGTPVMPDLSGHVVMVEEVSEYDYAVDRLLFHVTAGWRR